MYLHSSLMILKPIVGIIILVLQYALLPLFIYHFVISVFGWFKRKEENAENYFPVNRFALLVAAHNEEKVIESIVKNLKNLDYPTDMYDIFIVADNCSDNTAEIARQNGAIVFERFDKLKRGKGYALEWMFEKIFNMEKKYDAICVFDADNLVSLNFLKEMNKQLCKGYKVIQGYIDSKNPLDSLISASYAISYWLNNRLFQLARYYLGLSCIIGGTGFVVATDTLKEIGWGATCLTEDLEFTIKLVLKGKKVYWSEEAIVYDEKPITLIQSWRQRKRWMQGQADCACRYVKPLLYKFIKDKDMVAFDCALYVIQPLIVVISGVILLFNFFRFILFTDFSELLNLRNLQSAVLFFFTTYISVIFIFIEGRASLKVTGYFLLFPFYNLTWIPIIIQGYINKDKKEWSHTLHTRVLDITDVERLRSKGYRNYKGVADASTGETNVQQYDT
ncbi:MAG: glycosyltransferase family 2 protein [Firmicutes bacterium]|nr:glycosyltransferase family 2 protein [Bacillota bacterium]